MSAKTSKRRKASASNPLASALARREGEGGAPGPASKLSRDEPVPLSEEEGRILQCLGVAVLLQWNDLPTPIRRQLFEYAVTMGEARQTAQLKEQIARFLHKHKDGRTGIGVRRRRRIHKAPAGALLAACARRSNQSSSLVSVHTGDCPLEGGPERCEG
jgi:hypothetical protein